MNDTYKPGDVAEVKVDGEWRGAVRARAYWWAADRDGAMTEVHVLHAEVRPLRRAKPDEVILPRYLAETAVRALSNPWWIGTRGLIQQALDEQKPEEPEPEQRTEPEAQGIEATALCLCLAQDGYYCTRRADHTGEHVTVLGTTVVASWPQEPEPLTWPDGTPVEVGQRVAVPKRAPVEVAVVETVGPDHFELRWPDRSLGKHVPGDYLHLFAAPTELDSKVTCDNGKSYVRVDTDTMPWHELGRGGWIPDSWVTEHATRVERIGSGS